MSSKASASPVDFYGPRLKLERAGQHIFDLEIRFRDYIDNNIERLQPKRGSLKNDPRDKPKSFDKHIPTVLGDAIHNLRASLDHAYHIAAEANGAEWNNHRRFPFHPDKQDLIGSINGHKVKGIAPSEKVIDVIINEIQPYTGGKHALKGLHDLDIADKHIALIPTARVTHVGQWDVVDKSGAKTGGRISGIIIWDRNEQGGEFPFSIEGGGGVEVRGDPKDAFHILFDVGQPFANKPILPVINSLRDATKISIDLIEGAL